jgi:steroid delta-isomerase-like uncharacterized protein
MSFAENKKLVQRVWDDLVNRGRLESLDELVSPDFRDHTPLPGQPGDLDGLMQRLMMLHGAFPDFQSTILDLTAEGDKVVALIRSTGTHLSPFLGEPASGKPFTILEIHIMRLAAGKMVEHWGMPDFFGMLAQLGLVSVPWGAAAAAAVLQPQAS